MYEEYALDPSGSAIMDSGSFIGTYTLALLLAIGFYFAMMQYKTAHKTGNADIAWWAFIPIMNTLLLIQMAEKPWHWILYLLIPIVNIFAFFALWMAAAKNAGCSPVWGFLVMIPPISLLAIFVLATATRPYTYPDFSESSGPSRPQRPSRRPRTPQSVG